MVNYFEVATHSDIVDQIAGADIVRYQDIVITAETKTFKVFDSNSDRICDQMKTDTREWNIL